MRLRLPTVCTVLLAVLASPGPPTALAQTGPSYSMPWSNVSGGGPRVTGGAYQVLGAIGQPDVAAIAGGIYAVNGGFFAPSVAGPTDAPSVPVPLAFAFRAPVPNPARGAVAFSVELPRTAHVTLEIYSVDGRRVRRLMDAERGVGFHRIAWDGRTDPGSRAAPGVYFARVSADGASTTHRFVLLD